MTGPSYGLNSGFQSQTGGREATLETGVARVRGNVLRPETLSTARETGEEGIVRPKMGIPRALR